MESTRQEQRGHENCALTLCLVFPNLKKKILKNILWELPPTPSSLSCRWSWKPGSWQSRARHILGLTLFFLKLSCAIQKEVVGWKGVPSALQLWVVGSAVFSSWGKEDLNIHHNEGVSHPKPPTSWTYKVPPVADPTFTLCSVSFRWLLWQMTARLVTGSSNSFFPVVGMGRQTAVPLIWIKLGRSAWGCSTATLLGSPTQPHCSGLQNGCTAPGFRKGCHMLLPASDDLLTPWLVSSSLLALLDQISHLCT